MALTGGFAAGAEATGGALETTGGGEGGADTTGGAEALGNTGAAEGRGAGAEAKAAIFARARAFSSVPVILIVTGAAPSVPVSSLMMTHTSSAKLITWQIGLAAEQVTQAHSIGSRKSFFMSKLSHKSFVIWCCMKI